MKENKIIFNSLILIFFFDKVSLQKVKKFYFKIVRNKNIVKQTSKNIAIIIF